MTLFRIHESEEAQELLRVARAGWSQELMRLSSSEKWQELRRRAEAEGWKEPQFHAEVQDCKCDAWVALEDYIDRVAAAGSDEFNPRQGIGSELWQHRNSASIHREIAIGQVLRPIRKPIGQNPSRDRCIK